MFRSAPSGTNFASHAAMLRSASSACALATTVRLILDLRKVLESRQWLSRHFVSG